MPNCPCAGLFRWTLPVNRALSWDTALGSQGPAIVAHAALAGDLNGGKVENWPAKINHWISTKTQTPQVTFKKKKFEVFENSSLRPESSVPLWDGGCAVFSVLRLWCESSRYSRGLVPLPRPHLSWQSHYRRGLSRRNTSGSLAVSKWIFRSSPRGYLP